MGKFTQTLVIESRLDATIKARHWTAQHARTAGFDPKSVFAIELSVGEALANIIKHAYGGERGHEIHVVLTIDAAKLNLSIRDFGRKFDPTVYKPPNLGVPVEGGYGVYLIEQMMDEVTYDTSLERGTCLGLTKYRPHPD